MIVNRVISIDRIMKRKFEYEDYDGEKKTITAGDLLDYFLGHKTHRQRFEKSRLAWNIKVRWHWLKDHHYKEHGLDHKWDDKWEEYENSNEYLFGNCCEAGLDFVGDRRTRDCDFMGEETDYSLWQEGRSGGWLVLHDFDGTDPLEDIEAITECLYETVDNFIDEITCDEAPKKEIRKCKVCNEDTVSSFEEEHDGEFEALARAYRFCKALDRFDASDEFLHQMAFQRMLKEEEWEEERKQMERDGIIELEGQQYLSEEMEAMELKSMA